MRRPELALRSRLIRALALLQRAASAGDGAPALVDRSLAEAKAAVLLADSFERTPWVKGDPRTLRAAAHAAVGQALETRGRARRRAVARGGRSDRGDGGVPPRGRRRSPVVRRVDQPRQPPREFRRLEAAGRGGRSARARASRCGPTTSRPSSSASPSSTSCGRDAEAKALFDDATVRFAGSRAKARALRRLSAKLEAQAGKDPESADRKLAELWRSDPTDVEARALLHALRRTRALEALADAAHAEGHVAGARAKVAARAVAAHDRVLEVAPGDADAQIGAGDALFQAGDFARGARRVTRRRWSPRPRRSGSAISRRARACSRRSVSRARGPARRRGENRGGRRRARPAPTRPRLRVPRRRSRLGSASAARAATDGVGTEADRRRGAAARGGPPRRRSRGRRRRDRRRRAPRPSCFERPAASGERRRAVPVSRRSPTPRCCCARSCEVAAPTSTARGPISNSIRVAPPRAIALVRHHLVLLDRLTATREAPHRPARGRRRGRRRREAVEGAATRSPRRSASPTRARRGPAPGSSWPRCASSAGDYLEALRRLSAPRPGSSRSTPRSTAASPRSTRRRCSRAASREHAAPAGARGADAGEGDRSARPAHGARHVPALSAGRRSRDGRAQRAPGAPRSSRSRGRRRSAFAAIRVEQGRKALERHELEKATAYAKDAAEADARVGRPVGARWRRRDRDEGSRSARCASFLRAREIDPSSRDAIARARRVPSAARRRVLRVEDALPRADGADNGVEPDPKAVAEWREKNLAALRQAIGEFEASLRLEPDGPEADALARADRTASAARTPSTGSAT